MRLFHRTTQDRANAVLSTGFHDTTRTISGIEVTGAWVADRPFDITEGVEGPVLLTFRCDARLLMRFEIVAKGKPYREWCVPSAVLNSVGHGFKVTRLAENGRVDIHFERKT